MGGMSFGSTSTRDSKLRVERNSGSLCCSGLLKSATTSGTVSLPARPSNVSSSGDDVC